MSHPWVTIGVCTYRRPEGIRKCLASLLEQETDFPFEIVVTENEATMPSREIVESFCSHAAGKGIELRYFCEPIQNIALSRNRCVQEARGEFIAFLDDDEWAESNWLAKLMEVQKETSADVVWGIVQPIFPEDFPEYMKKIPNLENFSQANDLEKIYAFCTNNLLLRTVMRELREDFFDPAFGISGCSDAELACFLDGLGKKMIRTNRAKVYEIQPFRRGKYFFHCWKDYCVMNAVARVYRKHFYFLNGNKAILKLFLRSLGSFLFEIPRLFYAPRNSLVRMGFHVGGMAGIVAYYLGIRPRGY